MEIKKGKIITGGVVSRRSTAASASAAQPGGASGSLRLRCRLSWHQSLFINESSSTRKPLFSHAMWSHDWPPRPHMNEVVPNPIKVFYSHILWTLSPPLSLVFFNAFLLLPNSTHHLLFSKLISITQKKKKKKLCLCLLTVSMLIEFNVTFLILLNVLLLQMLPRHVLK